MERRPLLLTLAQAILAVSAILVAVASWMTHFASSGIVAEILAVLFSCLMAGAAAKRAKLGNWLEVCIDLFAFFVTCGIGAVVALSLALVTSGRDAVMACGRPAAGAWKTICIYPAAPTSSTASALLAWSGLLELLVLPIVGFAVQQVVVQTRLRTNGSLRNRRNSNRTRNNAARPPVAR